MLRNLAKVSCNDSSHLSQFQEFHLVVVLVGSSGFVEVLLREQICSGVHCSFGRVGQVLLQLIILTSCKTPPFTVPPPPRTAPPPLILKSRATSSSASAPFPLHFLILSPLSRSQLPQFVQPCSMIKMIVRPGANWSSELLKSIRNFYWDTLCRFCRKTNCSPYS